VRSALLDVMGVTRVQVMLEKGEAIVTYDPRAATTDALITAVNNAVGPFGGIQYKATLKEPPGP
jgi:copper chaperone CopZ